MADERLEKIKELISNGDADGAVKLAESYADFRVNSALSKYAENGFNQPAAEPTAEDAEKAELAKQIEAMKAEQATAQRKGLAKDFLSKRGLPSELADFALGDDEDTTISKANQLAAAIDSHIRTVKTATAGNAVPTTGVVNPKPDYDVRRMSAADIAKNWDNPDFQKNYNLRR
ncbi:capsid assembly scaffolding protein Gp46 family protein [Spirochaeta dissipatitropha]